MQFWAYIWIKLGLKESFKKFLKAFWMYECVHFVSDKYLDALRRKKCLVQKTLILSSNIVDYRCTL